MAAMTDPTLPYGLRDVKITPYNAAGVLGTAVDLPVAQTLTFSEAEEFEELRGDDALAAVRGQGPTVEWELEEGGISLAALAVFSGGILTSTGTTPNRKTTMAKLGTDARPYFKIEGQAISDSGGDFHVVIYKARVNDAIEGEMGQGAFWITSCSGIAIPDATNKLYDIVRNETAAAIV